MFGRRSRERTLSQMSSGRLKLMSMIHSISNISKPKMRQRSRSKSKTLPAMPRILKLLRVRRI